MFYGHIRLIDHGNSLQNKNINISRDLSKCSIIFQQHLTDHGTRASHVKELEKSPKEV